MSMRIKDDGWDPYYLTTGSSIPIELYQRIDRERGDVSRSRFILRLIEKGLDNIEYEKYLEETRPQ